MTLLEALRVLKQGGSLFVHLPDLIAALPQFTSNCVSHVGGYTRMRYYTAAEAQAVLEFIGYHETRFLPPGFLYENSLHILAQK